MKLTDHQVLRAVWRSPASFSAYIGQEISREHSRAEEGRERTPPPNSGQILRRLNSLAGKGLLTRDRWPCGHYGYRWQITPEGYKELFGEGPAR